MSRTKKTEPKPEVKSEKPAHASATPFLEVLRQKVAGEAPLNLRYAFTPEGVTLVFGGKKTQTAVPSDSKSALVDLFAAIGIKPVAVAS